MVLTAGVYETLPAEFKASLVDSIVRNISDTEAFRTVTTQGVYETLPAEFKAALVDSIVRNISDVEASRKVTTADVYRGLPGELRKAIHAAIVDTDTRIVNKNLSDINQDFRYYSADLHTSSAIARFVSSEGKFEFIKFIRNRQIKLTDISVQFTKFNFPRNFFLNKQRLGLWWARTDLKNDIIRKQYNAYVADKVVDSRTNPVLGPRFSAGEIPGKLFDVVNFAGDVADVLGVLSTFSDGVLYDPKTFVDVNSTLSASTINKTALNALSAQRTTLREHNTNIVDAWNRSPTNQATEDWPMAKQYFPMVSGPLDWLDTELAQGDAYITQLRVYVEHHTAMEYILRNDAYYRNNIIAGLGGQATYDRISATEPLIYYLGGEQPAISRDDYVSLYEAAYERVCMHHGGIYYKTKNPDDILDRTMFIEGKHTYKCGWNEPDCNRRATEWYGKYSADGLPPGQYAEWYTWAAMKADANQEELAKIQQMQAMHTGQSGACIATNVGLRATCSYFKGTYNSDNNESQKCTFSARFCKAQGMCYNTSDQTCYLPEGAIQGLSMFFGQNGPREWIRINGCSFNGNRGQTVRDAFLTATGVGFFFTETGQSMIMDALANQKNFNEGMRQALKSPTSALNFAASLVGVAALVAPNPVTIGVAVLLGIAAGLSSGIDAARLNIKKSMLPISDPREYSICGLSKAKDGTTRIKACSFVEGWVTKPIRLHQITDTARTPILVEKLSETKRINFFPLKDGLTTINGYLAFDDDAPQGKCFELNPPMIRGAADPDVDGGSGFKAYVWCVPSFPSDGYVNPEIGTLAPLNASEPFLTNKTWTNGVDPDIPMYPYSGRDEITQNHYGWNEKNHWYYQLVYEKDSIPSAALWDTPKMLNHFSESTLADMRKYYCMNAYINYNANPATAPGLDTRCLGYMNVQTPKYTIRPMTVLMVKPGGITHIDTPYMTATSPIVLGLFTDIPPTVITSLPSTGPPLPVTTATGGFTPGLINM
jgi:hypothetical protein